MTRSIRSAYFALFLAVPAFFANAQGTPVVAEKNGVTVSIVFKGDNAEITVSAAAKGWVAVGFNPTNRMKDADFLIGYVKDGVAFARDDFGVSATGHAADERTGGKNSLISFSGWEKDGITSVTFVRARDTGDIKDAKLTSGTHDIIVGYSGSDNFTGFHTKVGKTTITLP